MRILLAILGFFIGGGPIGAIIGYFIGSFIEKSQINISGRARQSQKEAFITGLSGLAAEVIKADGNVSRDEVLFVKEFFIKEFGPETASHMMTQLKIFTREQVPVEVLCLQIRQVFKDVYSRLMIIHFLHGLATADGEETPEEAKIINRIAQLLGISQSENRSAQGIFKEDIKSCYDILEVDMNCSDEEIKKAYRKAAKKYHPDKLSSLGEEVQKEATERFAKINAAYEKIKKERGLN